MLINELNEIIRSDSKSYGGISDDDFTTKTGFECIDYLNGQVITLDDGTKRLYTGVSNGRIIELISKSGCGKSTLAIQIGMSIIKRYENGLLYIVDAEQNNTKERVRMISGVSEEYYTAHCSILRSGVSTESTLRLLSKIKEFKIQHENELLVDNENGIVDKSSKEVIKILPPTVVILDSLGMLMSEGNLTEEEITGQMSTTQQVKINSQFFRKVVQICNRANIILIVINHITDNISTGPTPVAAQINYLKQTESISGGKVHLYCVDTLLKITAGTKLEPDKLWGIKGFEAKIEICKSRHAPAGRAVNMIYDQTNGFRNDLSMLDYIKSCGALKGNGMAYYIDGHEEYKFRLSNFKEKFDTIPEFREIITSAAKSLLKASIKESDNIKILEDQAKDKEDGVQEETDVASNE